MVILNGQCYLFRFKSRTLFSNQYKSSAECYKSDRHQDCSEDFFKKLVEEALRSDHVTTKEKEKMIQILKKQKEEIENEIPIEDFLKNNLSEKFEDLGLGEDENEDDIEEIELLPATLRFSPISGLRLPVDEQFNELSVIIDIPEIELGLHNELIDNFELSR